MTIRSGLFPLITMATAFVPAPAMATSDLYFRTPEFASTATCGGRLVEQVMEGGSVTYSYATLVLACMRSATKADWVLISGATCGDPVHYTSGHCEDKTASTARIQIRAFADYSERNRISVGLMRSSLGRNCTNVTGTRDAHWECQANESLPPTDLVVRAGNFTNAQGNFELPLFGKAVEIPQKFATGVGGYILDQTLKVTPPSTMLPTMTLPPTAPASTTPPSTARWWDDPRQITYADPESDAIVTLRCTAPGRMELVVGDPSEKSRKYEIRRANIFALGKTEQAAFRIVPGDGDQLVFSIPVDSVALSSLVEDRDFRIQIPSGEFATVQANGSSKHAAKLKAACAGAPSKVSSTEDIRNILGPEKAQPVAVGSRPDADENSGWWVVLANGPATPNRDSNGGLVVDRTAKSCGIRTFNDYSAKFEGFEPGYTVFVLLGSPYGHKEMAERNRAMIERCFPAAYVRHGRYRGE